jgi:uncharacterized UPF0146 family protein
MWKDFSEYIISNYKNASLIVEVGVGNFPLVAITLQEHLNMDIIMTDIKPYHANVVVDDITNPNLNIYRDASLIYSIRPPEELQHHIKLVAEDVCADLIIKPLSTEFLSPDKNMKLINYKKAIFYEMCNNEMAE